MTGILTNVATLAGKSWKIDNAAWGIGIQEGEEENEGLKKKRRRSTVVLLLMAIRGGPPRKRHGEAVLERPSMRLGSARGECGHDSEGSRAVMLGRKGIVGECPCVPPGPVT